MPYRLIDPKETLDYACDWAAFLADAGSPADTIATSTWSIAPSTGSPPAPALSGAQTIGAVTTVFVSGTALGSVYRLTNAIMTGQGRTAQRSFTIRCDSR